MSPTLTRDAARDHVSVHRPARIVVDAVDGRSRARVLEAGTFVSPRPMPGRGAGVKIALVGIRASLCAGDDFALRVEVGPGARVELVDPNGTVAFNARGGAASWRAELTLGEGAVVHWREQPFVLADGADVHREVRADLAPGAELLWRETLVLGGQANTAARCAPSPASPTAATTSWSKTSTCAPRPPANSRASSVQPASWARSPSSAAPHRATLPPPASTWSAPEPSTGRSPTAPTRPTASLILCGARGRTTASGDPGPPRRRA